MHIRVNHAGRTRCPEGWSLTPDRTLAWRDLDAWYLVDGFGRVRTESTEVNIRPGDLLIMHGGRPYTFYRDSVVTFVHYWAHFDILDSENTAVPSEQVAHLPFQTPMGDLTLMAALWDRLVASAHAGDGQEDAAVWLAAILAEANRKQPGSSPATDHDPRISECYRAIDDAPGERWTVATLAQKAGVSRSQFFRLFREAVGRSPQQYIVEARMRLARVLLRESALPIASIAATVGYNDPQFFSRHFHHHNGRSPRAFRDSV